MSLRLVTRYLYAGCSRLSQVTPSILTPQQCFTPFYLPSSFMSEFSPSISECSLPPSIFKPGAVIFDKDGTLVCFHTMWNSWCEELAKRMCAETETDNIAGHVYQLMGYDSDTKKIRMGMLAEKTHPYIKEKVLEMLIKQGHSDLEAKNVLEKTWKDTPENMQIKETGNLRILLPHSASSWI